MQSVGGQTKSREKKNQLEKYAEAGVCKLILSLFLSLDRPLPLYSLLLLTSDLAQDTLENVVN